MDWHCHALPGLDDGPADLDQALALLRAAEAAGTTHVVCTPHQRWPEWAGNTRQVVLAAVARLREAAEAAGLSVRLLPGSEVYIAPDLPERVAKGEVCTLNDAGGVLLVELPPTDLPPFAESVLFRLQAAGILPLLAHPERCWAFQTDVGRLAEWVGRGVALQVTAGALTGRFGPRVRDLARTIVRNGWASCLGSDAHSAVRRGPDLQQGWAVARELDRSGRLAAAEASLWARLSAGDG